MSTIKALLIPFDEDKNVELIDLEATLENIYDRVAPDSRMFEVVRGKSIELWGDEEGGPGMRGDAAQRINARAMQLFASDHGVGIEAFASPLCGDFLAVGINTGNHNTDVPEWASRFNFTWSNRPRA
jgi:hypothetical protein